jgi:hypothetical protein
MRAFTDYPGFEIQTLLARTYLAAGASPDIRASASNLATYDGAWPHMKQEASHLANTAAHYAAQAENVEGLRLVLTGDDPNCDSAIVEQRANAVNEAGVTPLMLGIRSSDVVELLLQHGANAGARDYINGHNAYDYALEAAQNGFRNEAALNDSLRARYLLRTALDQSKSAAVARESVAVSTQTAAHDRVAFRQEEMQGGDGVVTIRFSARPTAGGMATGPFI